MLIIPDLAESRTVSIPTTSDIDERGRSIRSLDALRTLTLCNCDCKLLTSAICRGLHWNTMRCVDTSERRTSSRQKTDSILEIETTALANVACARYKSGVLLSDFDAAYLSVNHSWISIVLKMMVQVIFDLKSLVLLRSPHTFFSCMSCKVWLESLVFPISCEHS